ncbi:NUDIX hydrolase [Neorhodopirellula pilleata]|uniref:GDP-mannose mannosyl hydrolase n=1 Tax=Neorhodopirellula pilleata TaxID=2714738 RepID=A0A5C5ZQS2_9BACT|nr:NUDIX domain-containing protein [Neorhodopirellula pilleata]TWT89408.1 GDP-mannose mannosyl hydrolase [Neorhodopirellula pilleata]
MTQTSRNEPIEQAFRFCPSCGVANQGGGSIPFRCLECGFAFFFGPVAAVGALIINSDNNVLLVRRSRNPGKNQWGLPGGFVDRDETIEEALAREVLEETSLVVRDCSLMLTGPNRYTYAGVTADVIDLFYLCSVENEQSVELAASELNDYRWCVPGPEYLDDMAFFSNRRALEHWLKIRSHE